MSGHSKWSTIKRKKAKVDAQRGKIFTRLAKEIILAARQVGGDPEGNIKLKTAIMRAKEANIPNENIMRAIQKGTGEIGGVKSEEIIYEGYGPGGVAVMINIITDNRNRTVGELRYIFSKNGGNLGESGCVSWLFEQKGITVIDKSDNEISEEDLLLLVLDSGAEDFKVEEDCYVITCDSGSLISIREALELAGIKIYEAEITMVPRSTVKIGDQEAKQMMSLMDMLEEQDDVQDVYANFEIID